MAKKKESLPEKIRRKRQHLGMRVEDVAFRVGVTASTVYRWESGKTWPHRMFMNRLKKVLNI